MWECGLKPYSGNPKGSLRIVTPHVGVWIETKHYQHQQKEAESLPMWECGLKQKYRCGYSHFPGRHSPCGSVD